jgi:ribonucleoside-diphosphate reductase alpha chain
MNRLRLPNRRAGIRVTIGTGPNRLTLSTGEYPNGRLGEIFLDHQKEGTFGRDILNAFAMAVSLGLQHGIPMETLAHTFRDFHMEPDFIREIFEALEENYGEKGAVA